MDFAPHITCLRNVHSIVAMFIVGDGLTSLAYKLIPLELGLLIYWRRHDVMRSWRMLGMLGLFAAFIFCCGGTHDLKLWDLYHTDYRLEATWAVVTGNVSFVTACLLGWYLPTLRHKPLPFQVETATRRLRALVAHADELAAAGEVSADIAAQLQACRADLETLP